MTRSNVYSKFSTTMILAPALALAAACGREQPRVDDALRNDLSLATQAQQYRPQQYVSPQELGPNGLPYATQPGQAGYAPNGYYVAPAPAPAPAPVRERVVYRTRSSGSSSRGSSGGGYSTASTARATTPMKRNTKRDAAIGAAAGAAIGVATSRDKLKGGIIGGVAGAVLGGVLGNNVDVKRNP